MNAPLRVLTVTATLLPGGVAGRILGMAHGLDRSRISQRICLLHGDTSEIDEQAGTTLPLFKDLGIPIDSLGMRHPAAGTVLPTAQRVFHSASMFGEGTLRLAQMVRERGVDVIDAHTAPATLIAGVAGKMTRTPVVATEYYIGEPAPVMLWPLVGRAALDLADAVVTDSRPRANDLRKWMYRRKDKIRIIPNGIEPPVSALDGAQARQLFGIGNDDIVITQISTLQPHKGHTILLDAAKQIIKRAPNARFLIIGFTRERSSAYSDELHTQAARLGIGHRVRIAPYPGPIGDVWAATDIHAHATLFDSLPNAIIEGMSLAKPAVVTAVGGIPDLVEHERTGLVVRPNDASSFAHAVLRLIEDRAFARNLGLAAQERYRNGYTSRDTAHVLEALFRDMAARQCASL